MLNESPLLQLVAYGRTGDEHDCDFCREEHGGFIENQYLHYHWRKMLGEHFIVDSGYIWLERFYESTKNYNIDVRQKICKLESDLQSLKEQNFLTRIKMNFLDKKEDMMRYELSHQKFLLDKDNRLQITRDLFDSEARRYLSYVEEVVKIRDAQNSVFWSRNPFSAKMPQELLNHTKQYMDNFKTTHLTPPKLHHDLKTPPTDKIESNILKMLVRKDKNLFLPITSEMSKQYQKSIYTNCYNLLVR